MANNHLSTSAFRKKNSVNLFRSNDTTDRHVKHITLFGSGVKIFISLYNLYLSMSESFILHYKCETPPSPTNEKFTAGSQFFLSVWLIAILKYKI